MTIPTPVPEAPAAPTAGAPRRRRRWLIAIGTAWALLLGAAAGWSYHRDAPTVREQRTIAQAAPVVDRAVGEVVGAVFDADAVVGISGRRLRAGCRLTPAWAGAELERTVTIRSAAADAPALVDRIADGLPAGYRAGVSGAGGVRRIRADAGEFVAISGAVTSPGVVSVSVRTGCRPPSDGFELKTALEVEGAERMTTARANLIVLRAEGIDVVDVAVVPCPAGEGFFTSQVATGRGELGPAVAQIVRRGGNPVIVDEPDHLAARIPFGSFDLREADGVLTSSSVEARCPPWVGGR
ncbi:MAG TPA: hypothetical protein VFT95_00225 [Micromonosporaceae bacterium]|nr:hypothetical protein [Micromonosporaceae bacterium]